MCEMAMPDQHHHEPEKPLTFLEVMGSVLWTAFGVSTRARRERDFRRGKGWQFFVAGVIYMLLLLSGLIVLVNYLAHHR
jgi:hypothetical protein